MSTRTGLLLLASVAGVAVVILLRQVILVAFLGLMLATMMSFPINLMARKISRGVAVLLVLIGGAGFFTGVGFIAYAPLSDQVSQLVDRMPEGIQRMQTWFVRTGQKTGVVESPEKAVGNTIKNRISRATEQAISMAAPAAMSATAVLTGLVLIIVLGAFFAHEPRVYAQTCRALLPERYEVVFDEMWTRLGESLKHWLGGIFISMTIMGTVTAVGLLIAGVQDWFILGFLTFLGTFTPYVGAIASAIPGLILALSQSTEHFLAALLVYLIVHLVEGYLVEPFVMKRAVVIHPGTLLLWQLAMGSLFGLLGVIVATPLLACLKAALGYLYVERVLHKELTAI